MSAGQLIDGRAIAADITRELSERVNFLKSKGVQPGLAFVRVGEDPASKVYVGMKESASARVGIRSVTHALPESIRQAELLDLLGRLNADREIHGILVQAPLPPHLSNELIGAAVFPDKDVDGFHPINLGKLLLGDRSGFVPCTPLGVSELFRRSGVATAGAHVVILGRGIIVGKPMAALLLQKNPQGNATVTICHSASRQIDQSCRQADILIAALGVPQFVKREMVKPGAVVIDVGVNRLPDPGQARGYRLVGDVEFDSVRQVAGRITPNPGGVGPMTVAMLMSNTVRAAELSLEPKRNGARVAPQPRQVA